MTAEPPTAARPQPAAADQPTAPPVSGVEHVLLAAPRGFCAGVEMAIKALAWMVRAFEPPVIEHPEPQTMDTSAYAKPEGEELVIAYADASLSNSWRVMFRLFSSVASGIARMTGMDIMEVPGATGDTDTNLTAKAEAAKQAACTYPFVLLHINGADEAAHRRNPAEKRAFLHEVDSILMPSLLESNHKLVVVSDHTTDPYSGLHEGGIQEAYVKNAF